ncbi:hypothetical protein CANCADRAFT_20078, partial [Tortispora caseinolytica NRRL Y-17796]
NPALKALGLPRFRLPSRNWSIFWLVVGSITGGIIYDRREKKRIRNEWCERVSYLAKEPLSPLAMPRKVIVYMAPPPGDHIGVTEEHFRHYVKPILVAGALDFEVKKGMAQGEIRNMVANDIRNKRTGNVEGPDELLQPLNELLTRDNTGGVLCIGRGAYREYIDGVHEGWLGPTDNTSEAADEAVKKTAIENPTETAAETAAETTEVKEKNEPKKVPKAWIRPADYNEAEIDPRIKDMVPDPVAYVPQQHILGFRNTPLRTYWYFTRRHLADRVGEATAAAVIGSTRAWREEDSLKGIEEVANWPTKWKRTAEEKGSEWIQPLVTDARVTEHLKVYE